MSRPSTTKRPRDNQSYLKEIRTARLAAFKYLSSVVKSSKAPESAKMRAAELLVGFDIRNAGAGQLKESV